MSHRSSDDALRRIEPIDRDRLLTSWSDSEAKQALFQEITSMSVEAPPRPVPGKPAASRRSVVLAATLGVMALATAAGALSLLAPTSQTTGVACHIGDDTVAIIQATTGDPALDCQAHWAEQTGEDAPEMVAYDNGSGGIEVLPVSDDAPEQWRALEPGIQQMPELIELEAALDDVIDGLRTDCFTLPAGEAIAHRELERLGLADWTVTSERGDADGTETCTHFYLSGLRKQVVLVPTTGSSVDPDEPVGVFARRLGAVLSDRCVTLTEAATIAADLAADAGLAKPQFVIRDVADPDAECTRAEVVVGGIYSVTLRGPAA